MARVFVNEFVALFGVPESLHTDQSRNFESTLKKCANYWGLTTTPYYPQLDGMIERFNRTLLSTTIEDDENDWDLKLPFLMLTYRSSVHEATKETPFKLIFGREVCLSVDIMFGRPALHPCSSNQYVNELRK